MQIIKKSQKNLNKAVEFLNNSGIMICPTDTVYGFLADAGNKKAVDKIYKIKKRPKSKPLAIFVKDLKMTKKLAEINKEQEAVLTLRLRSGQAKYWPGKYTFILKSKVKSQNFKLSKLVTGKDGTIALRIPRYKFLNSLLKKINKPLAQTSVNISGKPPLTKINDIIEQFKKYDILIIDGGNLPKSKPSKILELKEDKIKTLRI